jgi:4-amino-4-deoxychorismate lyase
MLAEKLVQQGVIKSVQVADIPVAQARGAVEMMLIGSSIAVAPIVQWDGQPIGDGKPGKVTAALRRLLEQDMRSGEGVLIDVPY